MPPSVKDALNWITNPLVSLYGHLQTPTPIQTPNPEVQHAAPTNSICQAIVPYKPLSPPQTQAAPQNRYLISNPNVLVGLYATSTLIGVVPAMSLATGSFFSDLAMQDLNNEDSKLLALRNRAIRRFSTHVKPQIDYTSHFIATSAHRTQEALVDTGQSIATGASKTQKALVDAGQSITTRGKRLLTHVKSQIDHTSQSIATSAHKTQRALAYASQSIATGARIAGQIEVYNTSKKHLISTTIITMIAVAAFYYIGLWVALGVGACGIGRLGYKMVASLPTVPIRAALTNEQLAEAINPTPPLNLDPEATEAGLIGIVQLNLHTYLRSIRRKIEIDRLFGTQAPETLLRHIAHNEYEDYFNRAIDSKLDRDNISPFLKPLYKVAIKIKRLFIRIPLAYIASKIETKLLGKVDLLKPQNAQKLMDLISSLATGLGIFSRALIKAHKDASKDHLSADLKDKITQNLSQNSSLRADKQTLEEFNSTIIDQVLRDIFDWSLVRIVLKKVITLICPNPIETLTQQLPNDTANGINLEYNLLTLIDNHILKPLIETLKQPQIQAEDVNQDGIAPAFADRNVGILQKTLQSTILAIKLTNCATVEEVQKVFTEDCQTSWFTSNPTTLFINPNPLLKAGADQGALLILKSLEKLMLKPNQLLKLTCEALHTLNSSFSRPSASSLPAHGDIRRAQQELNKNGSELIDILIDQIKKSPAFDFTALKSCVNQFRSSARGEGRTILGLIEDDLLHGTGEIRPETFTTFLKTIEKLDKQADKIIRDNGITNKSIVKFLEEPTSYLKIFLEDFTAHNNNEARRQQLFDALQTALSDDGPNPVFKEASFSLGSSIQDNLFKSSIDDVIYWADIPGKVNALFKKVSTFVRDPITLRYLGIHVPLAEYIRV
jgi:hypothetical protein